MREEVAINRVYQALAHPVRRQVLRLLRGGCMTAGEIAERVEVTKPTLSGHFAVLREAGLIWGERNGTTISYHLNASLLEEALLGLMDTLGVERGNGDRPTTDTDRRDAGRGGPTAGGTT